MNGGGQLLLFFDRQLTGEVLEVTRGGGVFVLDAVAPALALLSRTPKKLPTYC